MEDVAELAGSIKLVSNISPTGFTTAMKCSLNAVWKSNGRPPLLPSSPAARVGAISHRLLSEAGQGRLRPDRETISSRWDELTEEIHSEMRESSIERHLIPLSGSVSDMAVRRIRAVRRAFEIASSRWGSQSRRGRARSHSGYGYEVPVQSCDEMIRGRIDAAVPTDRGIMIQDFKSGRISNGSGQGGEEIREEYQVQLKLYAALYAETFGRWPDSVGIVHLSGAIHNVDFTIAECAELLLEAKTTLQQINAIVATSPEASLPSVLANPRPDACAYCQYRPACEPYQSSRSDVDSLEWPMDVIGTLTSISQLGNGRLILKIMTSSGIENVPGISTGSRHAILAAIRPSDRIGVFALRRTRLNGPYSESQLTTVYELPTSVAS